MKKNIKAVMLSVFAPSEAYDTPEAVVVYFDPQQLLKQRDEFVQQRKLWKSLNYHHYSTDADWLKVCVVDIIGVFLTEAESETLRHYPVAMKTGFDIGETELVRVECQELVLDDRGVFWTALIKHTDWRLESVTLSFEDPLFRPRKRKPKVRSQRAPSVASCGPVEG